MPGRNLEPLEDRLTKNFSFAYNTLSSVFEHLEINDLICASMVCRMWKWVIIESGILSAHPFGTCRNHIKTIAEKYRKEVKHLVVFDFTKDDWFPFVDATNEMHKIEKLSAVNSYAILQALPMVHTRIKEVKLYSLKPYELCSTLEFVRSSHLTTIDFGLVQAVSSLRPLCYYNPNLKSLSINISEKFDMDLDPLMTLRKLKNLSIHFFNIDCIDLDQNCRLWYVLLSLTSVKSLHIRNCFNKSFDILKVIGNMLNLEELSLSGILLDKSVQQINFKQNLTYCKNIKKLYINISCDPLYPHVKSVLGSLNFAILTGIQELQNNLSHLKLNFQSFNDSGEIVVPVDYRDQVVWYSTINGLRDRISVKLPKTKVVVENKPFSLDLPIDYCLLCNVNARFKIKCREIVDENQENVK